NHLHASHIKFAFRMDADCICEKPLTLTVDEIEELKSAQKSSARKLYTILQLRFHPKLIELKRLIEAQRRSDHQIELTYVTTRGPWYHTSWKGDVSKSGGIATNIGVHFFDLLNWLFGEPDKSELHYSDSSTQSGFLQFKNASVKWLLSID